MVDIRSAQCRKKSRAEKAAERPVLIINRTGGTETTLLARNKRLQGVDSGTLSLLGCRELARRRDRPLYLQILVVHVQEWGGA